LTASISVEKKVHTIKGTGLGLTIVTKILEKHHGRITVASVLWVKAQPLASICHSCLYPRRPTTSLLPVSVREREAFTRASTGCKSGLCNPLAPLALAVDSDPFIADLQCKGR
jgi:hypothetical protein